MEDWTITYTYLDREEEVVIEANNILDAIGKVIEPGSNRDQDITIDRIIKVEYEQQ